MGFKKISEDVVGNLIDSKTKSKRFKVSYKNVSFIKSHYDKGQQSFIFKCFCGSYIDVKARTIYCLKSKGCLEDINCGCIKDNTLQQNIDTALKEFNTKFEKSEIRSEYCSYCESYRSKVVNKVGVTTFYCDCCTVLVKNRVQVGETFEEIMKVWNPCVEGEDYKLLPVLKGNVKKGYKVVTSTKVDANLYEFLKDVLWVKDFAGYAHTSMSKENLKRINKGHVCYAESKSQVKLHRVVLGIVDVPAKEIVGDHINGDVLDNRHCNLRKSTLVENNRNSKKSKNTKYEYIGVCEDLSRKPHTRRWRASLNLGSKIKTKYFYTKIDAAHGYDTLLRTYRPSDFNVYNFPEIGERGKDGNIRTE